MQTDFAYIGLFFIVVFIFTLSMLLIPLALRFLKIVPHNPNPIKNDTFECGMQTIGKAWVQFNFRYYFYALMFVALDVIAIFLYPWAVSLRKVGTFGFFAALVLIAIVFVGYIYAWKKKVLEWK